MTSYRNCHVSLQLDNFCENLLESIEKEKLKKENVLKYNYCILQSLDPEYGWRDHNKCGETHKYSTPNGLDG